MKQYIKIDEDGYAIFLNTDLPFNQRVLDTIWLNDWGDIPNNCILAYEDKSFYHPRWNGSEWVEGLTQEEIDELYKQPEKEPNKLELLQEQVLQLQEYIVNQEKESLLMKGGIIDVI